MKFTTSILKKIPMVGINKPTQQELKILCFHNRHGTCFIDYKGDTPCRGVCDNYKAYNEDLKKRVNKKLIRENRINNSDPVEKWHIDLAFGFIPLGDEGEEK
jgi:hypothetical protein